MTVRIVAMGALCALSLSVSACKLPEQGSVTPNRLGLDDIQSEVNREMRQDEVQLLAITSDATPGQSYDFRAIVDADGRAVGLRYLSRSGDTKEFAHTALRTGAVIMVQSGKNVVTLFSNDYDPAHGGTIRLHYLYDGLSGEYRDFAMEIRKDETGWAVYRNDSAGRRKITTMFLKKNERFIIGTVGIKEIRTN